ncbi:MAG: hypothetical protein KA473_10960 [Anaerolineales bacterium]|nr:hypothetical protein [Anaerolineales bacterium]MBP6209944.1 hypothetical protein [Anaerolineales bacterium]
MPKIKEVRGKPGKKETISDIGVKFLLEEFNAVRSFKEQSVAIADKRVDSLLTFASALAAGLGLFSRLNVSTENFLTIAEAGVLSLLLIGVITFKQVVDRSILIVDYIRSINRIRAYFAERVPQIQPYILMPISHEFPSYQWQSSNHRIPMVINGIAVGVIVIIGNMLFVNSVSPNLILLAIGIIVALLIYNLQSLYARRSFQIAERKSREMRAISLFKSHQDFREATRN